MTRISEGMTRWTIDVAASTRAESATACREYLDQIIDGQPVGLAE